MQQKDNRSKWKIIKSFFNRALSCLLRCFFGKKFSSDIVFNPHEVKKVLVYAYSGVGNFVFYTATLKKLKKFLPEAHFTLAHGNDTGCHEIVAGSDLFDKYLIISRNIDFWTGIKWIYKIRREKYDLIVSEFHNSDNFLIFLTMLSDAKYRVGYVSSPGWRNIWDWVYNIKAMMKEDQHEVDRYFELAYALGVNNDKQMPAAFAHIENEDKLFAERFLEDNEFQKGDTLITLHPATSPDMRWKQWPLEKYRELCRRILELPRCKIMVLGTSRDHDLVSELFNGKYKRVVNAVGKTTIKQAAALIAKSSIFIGNDSGPAKMSIALDIPTITLWGPSDYPRAKAWKPGHIDIRKDLDCSPCFKLEGTEAVENCPYAYKCLALITVDEVFDAVKEKLGISC